jgi:hypothetical protein
MTRLEALSPDLARRLQEASASKQRAAGLAAAEFALAHAGVRHPLVESALAKVRSAGALAPKDKAQLDTLAAQLDEEYFALQQAAERGQSGSEEYMRVFGQARAVSALAFAGREDALQAATEAIYEAAATTDDKKEFFAVVQSALD